MCYSHVPPGRFLQGTQPFHRGRGFSHQPRQPGSRSRCRFRSGCYADRLPLPAPGGGSSLFITSTFLSYQMNSITWNMKLFDESEPQNVSFSCNSFLYKPNCNLLHFVFFLYRNRTKGTVLMNVDMCSPGR